jgi:hypothetical protein
MATWTQTGERTTWAASLAGAVLTVTRTGVDSWAPRVEWPGGKRDRGPVCKTRLAGQRWAERRAREGNVSAGA